MASDGIFENIIDEKDLEAYIKGLYTYPHKNHI